KGVCGGRGGGGGGRWGDGVWAAWAPRPASTSHADCRPGDAVGNVAPAPSTLSRQAYRTTRMQILQSGRDCAPSGLCPFGVEALRERQWRQWIWQSGYTTTPGSSTRSSAASSTPTSISC